MKSLFLANVVVIACVGHGVNQPALAAGPPDTYCIYSPTKKPSPTSFQLVVRGKAYFDVLGIRQRNEDQKAAVQSLFESTPEWVFKLENLSDDRIRIKLRDTSGYLSADYETTPPTVVERPKPDDSSNWQIIPEGARRRVGETSWRQQAYIQNVGWPDHKLWLSIDAKPILGHHRPDDGYVREYRKAILTDTKTIFEISKREMSK